MEFSEIHTKISDRLRRKPAKDKVLTIESDPEKQRGYFFDVNEVSESLRESAKAVGQITRDGKFNGTAWVTTVDGSKYLIGAHHCFIKKEGVKGSQFSIDFVNGNSYELNDDQIIGDFEIGDTRIYRLDSYPSDSPTLEIDENFNSKPNVPIKIFTIGFPSDYLGGVDFTTRPVIGIGEYIYAPHLEDGSHLIRARLEPGNSGGPVIDARGKAIAMVTGSSDNKRDYGAKRQSKIFDAANHLVKGIPNIIRSVEQAK